MAFPATALNLSTEFLLGGAWTDVSADTLVDANAGYEIVAGHRNESSIAEPSTFTFQLNNANGKYSPRNPLSPYYGSLTRNTQARFSVRGEGPVYGLLPGGDNGYFTTGDTAALDIVGDIEIRWQGRVDLFSSNENVNYALLSKYDTTGNQRSWGLTYFNGYISFAWSPDGTLASLVSAQTSVMAVPNPSNGFLALKMTLDVNNGAGGSTCTFYTSDSISGTWTQLGSPIVNAGVTSIFSSSAGILIGGSSSFSTYRSPLGRVEKVEIRNGIAGTVVANPDFTAATAGASTLTDSTGKVWTAVGQALITDRIYRFHGEISDWPQKWTVGAQHSWVELQAAGILRRLGAGTKPVKSALRRGIDLLPASSGVVAYWPMEDEAGSTQYASGVGNGLPMAIVGTPGTAAYSNFLASLPIPTLGTGKMVGSARKYTSTGSWQVRFLANIPAATTTNVTLFSAYGPGSASRWDILYVTGGSLRLRAADTAGTLILDTTLAFAVDDKDLLINMSVTQNGSGVDWLLSTLQVGASSGSVFTGTLALNTVTSFSYIRVNPNGNATGVAMGHMLIQSQATDLFGQQVQLNAWVPESAGSRILRLCTENDVKAVTYSNDDDSETMGSQLPKTLMDLIGEAADLDMGMLHEARDFLGLVYRTRKALTTTLAPTQTLSYATACGLAGFDPIEDSQGTYNDVTVSREGGSSARVQLLTGALSVQDPPSGIGTGYDVTQTLNAGSDSRLADLAAWLLHTSTCEDPRFPSLPVIGSRVTSAALMTWLKNLALGDTVALASLPVGYAPDTIYQLLRGYTERLGWFTWDLDLLLTPARPYAVAVLEGTGATAARFGSEYSTLAASATSTATTLSVACTDLQLWTTAAGDFPFDILVSGERITVTGISGTTSPQSFTVTRSVNGIVKALPAGAKVDLFTPTYIGL